MLNLNSLRLTKKGRSFDLRVFDLDEPDASIGIERTNVAPKAIALRQRHILDPVRQIVAPYGMKPAMLEINRRSSS